MRRQQVKTADEEVLGLGARLSSGVLWEEMWERINAKAVNWGFVGWLALFWVLTLFLVGGLRSVRARSDHGTPVLDVLGWTVEILHVLAFLAILCLLVAIAIRGLARRLQSGT